MDIRKLLICSALTLFSAFLSYADDGGEAKGANVSETIVHHILDSHDWHLTDWPVTDEHGNKSYKAIGLHLPWLFYSSKDGFVFASGHDLGHKGYVPYHEHLYALKGGEVELDEHGAAPVHTKEEWEVWKTANVNEQVSIYDFSLTRTSLQVLLVGILMIITFLSIAKSYTRRAGQAPKGLQSLLEPLIVFVRDDIVGEYIPHSREKFTPYFLSLFFFIWFSNLLGLTPLNSNIMGNISVTAALAFFTFLIVQFNGTKDYWRHIIAMPGVPIGVIPVMTIIEIVSLFVKPFALAIRLFANITAGHFMILSLVSLIFIMSKGGTSVGGAMGIMPISVLFTIAIFCLEMIVAIIQAYIFTLLSAVFLGMSMESHDDHHGDHH
jgi:F-type H+-transporting ATPase subunit a